MHRILTALFLTLCSTAVWSQAPSPTPAFERLEAFGKYQKLRDSGWVRKIPFRNAGPRIFSGRVVDIAVNPDKPTEFLLAYASGGLWITRNNGASFTPLFDQEAAMTIGAIAADWRTGTFWVGTGEVNSSRSSYAGLGVYVSRDTGRTWTHAGLPESHHIGRIVLDPTTPERAWVAVLGHLYSDNPERGVYRTDDGGLSWKHTLMIDPATGAVDLVMDPKDKNILYAATWQRSRSAWNLEEAGEGSGVYRSIDGGHTWQLLSGPGTGFPSGPHAGRIGLSVAVQDGQRFLYALIDNQAQRADKQTDRDTGMLNRDALRTMTAAQFLALREETIAEFLKENGFPEKYTVAYVRGEVSAGRIGPDALVHYLEDANAGLFNTRVVGPELYLLSGQDTVWRKTHEGYIDDLYYTYGYYFGQVRTRADEPKEVYLLGVPILRSMDGGKTFRSVNGENVHVDHHALWINPKDPAHLLLGNDGGANLSFDRGDSWVRLNRPPVGQFYTVAVDNEQPFRIYGGLQDNGVWRGPSTYEMDHGWEMSGRYPYENLLGGDGMQVRIDPRDGNRTVYTGFQFGNYFRIDTHTGERNPVRPRHELGERPLRWNWQTPIHLSRHQPDILYMGSHRFHRSLDRGEHFEALSGDLTQGPRTGDVPFGTLSSIHESPLRFGLLYAGSDDGLVHVSKDGGFSWKRIDAALPQGFWVSRVIASMHREGRVYVCLNGYRQDHFEAMIHRSDDYGATWQPISSGLPDEPVNVICEDPSSASVLYAGTDHGAYVTLDGGSSWMPFVDGLPRVPVHDMVLHDSSRTLVLGTHGRSIYLGDVSTLGPIADSIATHALEIFPIADTEYRKQWGKARNSWSEPTVPVWQATVWSARSGMAEWAIRAAGKPRELVKGRIDLIQGLNFLDHDLSMGDKELMADQGQRKREFLPKGSYELEIRNGKDIDRKSFVIE